MNATTKKQPWVDVAIFENLMDGLKLETFLKQSRFTTRTYNHRMLQLFLFLCPPHAIFHIQVRSNDYKVVADILNRNPTAKELVQKAIHCPQCHSLRVLYPQMTHDFSLPALVGIIFHMKNHEAYCENCHHRWTLPKDQISQPLERAPQAQFSNGENTGQFQPRSQR